MRQKIVYYFNNSKLRKNRSGLYITAVLCIMVISAALTSCSSVGNPENATEIREKDIGNTKKQEGKKSDTKKSDTDPVSRDIFAMDTYMTLTAYGERAEEALDAAVEEIQRIEELVSTGIDTSEIARINQDGQGTVSKDTEYLIERSKELYEDTGGVFDITVYPVMKAWGFTNGEYRIPEKEELTRLLSNMGAGDISCQEGYVSVGKTGMQIDLGGIAKGYTSGRVMDIFRQYGVDHAVISLGGNVQVRGTKPDGSSWRVAIEDPEDTAEYIGIVEVEDKAVITSGGYERYFEEDGKVYHHIIDPSTGYPAESGLTSVTIVSADGTLADGLSTSLFIMGKEKAEQYWRNHSSDFDAVFVEEDGNIFVTDGIADTFSSDRDWQIIHKLSSP